MVLPTMLLPTNDLFPGWHTDPRTPAAERFWDGRSWTDKTRPAPKPVSAAPSAPSERSSASSAQVGPDAREIEVAEDLTVVVDHPIPEPIPQPAPYPIADPVSIFVARDRSDADLFQVSRRVQLPPAGAKHRGIERRSSPARPILVGVAALLIGAIGGFLFGFQLASNDVEVPAVSQVGATVN